MTIVGGGAFRYEARDRWGELPRGWSLGDVAGVAMDSGDRMHVFNRGDHPLIVFDADGRFVRAFGEAIFKSPHGIFIGPDDTIYCVDDGDHTVRKFSADGHLLLTIGVPGNPAAAMSGDPFNRCTHAALTPSGDILVSDGYGNARVHQFSAGGRLRRSWGEPGSGPGQFNNVHNICCDRDGRFFIADRENDRVQLFDGDGRFLREWRDFHRPAGLCLAPGDSDVLFYVSELAPALAPGRAQGKGPRVSIVGRDGNILARIGGAAGLAPGRFMSPHGVAVDSRGDLYIGELTRTVWDRTFPGAAVPAEVRTLIKLEKR